MPIAPVGIGQAAATGSALVGPALIDQAQAELARRSEVWEGQGIEGEPAGFEAGPVHSAAGPLKHAPDGGAARGLPE